MIVLVIDDEGQGRSAEHLAEVDGGHDDEHHEDRQRQEGVRKAHQQRIQPAAVIAREAADHESDQPRNQCDQQPDGNRHARSVHQPDEHVAAEFVGSQQVEAAEAFDEVLEPGKLVAGCRGGRGLRLPEQA